MTPPRDFPYSADRGGFVAMVATFFFLVLGESAVLALIIGVAVKDPLLRAGLFGLLALLLLAALGWMLSPLWTRHRLSAETLHLRYGVGLRLDLPRSAIVAAQPTREDVNPIQALVAQHDPKKQRLLIALSSKGQLLLHLAEPLPIHIWPTGGGVATSILLNADDRDALLTALALPQTPPPAVPRRSPSFSVTQHPTPSTQHPVLIRVEGLTRRYHAFTAVDGLNLEIRGGEIYGFLGANGAGKTTTLKMLVGLLEPHAGRAWVGGHNVWAEPLAAKATFGYVADRAILYERLTAREFLAFLAQVRGLPLAASRQRAEELLALLGLAEQADRPCGAYSFGMKRKLSLAGALLHAPAALLLDEPLNGLDPRSARHLKDSLLDLAAQGTAILLSTHDLATAETLCHRVGILHQGRLVAEGSAHDLRQMEAAPTLESLFLELTAEREVAA